MTRNRRHMPIEHDSPAIRRPGWALSTCAALLGALSVLPVQAVTPPPSGDSGYDDAEATIFLDGVLTYVYVTMSPADLQDCLDDPYSDIYKPCTVQVVNSVIDETIGDVGIRPRGNTSRSSIKKSWKLSFNRFAPGREFHGLEKFNLNGEHNDVSIIRSKLAWDLFKEMGVPSPRAHHVYLKINNGAHVEGIHINVEQIDDEFVDTWFGNDTGNLYKCLYQGERADLKYVWPGTAETYQYLGGGSTYQEENNEASPDYSDLAAFIDFVNNTDDATFAAGLVNLFSVDNFLRAMAVDVAVGQWDNYWYGANNYYLYHNADTNRFEYLPYDYDNTYGVDFFGIDWATRPFDHWGHGGYGSSGGQLPPLIRRVLEVPEYEALFRRYLRQLADGPFTLGHTEARIDQIKAIIGPYAFAGSYDDGHMDWTYDSTMFDESYTFPPYYRNWGWGWDWGLKPYIQERANDLLLTVPAPAPLPRLYVNEMLAINATVNVDEMGEYEDWVEIYNDGPSEFEIGGLYLSDNPGRPTKWQIPAGTTIPAGGFILVWCDEEPLEGPLHASFKLAGSGEGVGLFHNDANRNVLIDYLAYPPLGVDISYGRYPDGTENLMEFPAVTPASANDNSGGPPPEPGPTPPILINEWMAKNNTGIQDELGEYDDWIELYNAGPDAVDLGGRYLTDDLADRNKWRIPEGVTIAPRSYLLFWADEDEEQGPMHTSFKLRAAGESIGLFDRTSNYLAQIDSLSFGQQAADVSEGRFGDGTACIITLRVSTPAATNMSPLGDVDDDGLVDATDFAAFGACLAGPGQPPAPACDLCVDADLDNDGDVDLADFETLQANFGSF